MNIVNVVVLYRNAEEVIEYACKLNEQKNHNEISLVVVINDIENYSSDLFKKKLDDIDINSYIYDLGENLGYLNGFLYGVRKFIDENDFIYDWVVLSNTDILYSQNDFFVKFSQNKYDSNIWCVSPSIYLEKYGIYQNPSRKYRVKKRTIKRFLSIYKNPIIGNVYIWLSYKKKWLEKRKKPIKPLSGIVYSVHGAYFIFRKEFIKYIINKDFNSFLYCEESFIAEHIYRCNKKIFYDSSIEIIHNEHSVTKSLKLNQKRLYMFRSTQYIYNEFYR